MNTNGCYETVRAYVINPIKKIQIEIAKQSTVRKIQKHAAT